MKKPSILELFLSFFKIGAFTFGGGYAMMPIMQREVVEKKKWASDDDILDILVISESTPGVLAVNSATFIGYKIRGFWGSFFATLGVVLPSFIVITLLSLFIVQFKENQIVAYAFMGIRAGVAMLIFNAVFKLSKKLKKDWFTYVIIMISFVVALLTQFSVIWIILISAVIGILHGVLTHKGEAVNKHD